MSGITTKQWRKGFSLIEVLVGTAIFLIVAIGVYGSLTSLLKLANGAQARTLAVQLADEQFEIIRNLPYSSVGLTNGIPVGVLLQTQTLTRGGVTFIVGLTVRNINLSSTTVQASDKLVEVDVTCPTCQNFQPVSLTGQISPANLQSAGNGGAVVTQVFNGNGDPVQGATVSMQSTATSTIINTDVTDNSGVLNVIGVPPGVNVYKVTVTKSGYSTDETYAIGGSGNPNPTNPNLTVLNQQVTSASFAIDKLSSIHFSSVSPLCVPAGNVHFSMVGAKQIGASLPKYSQNLQTNGSGSLDLSSMEWDTYTITSTDSSFDLAGINPFSPFTLNPNNDQSVQLVVLPHDGNSLMVTVEDGVTNLPISGAVVELSKSGYDQTYTTGQGYMSQTDWTGGSGQVSFTDETKYFGDNGLVDVSTSTGNILLKDIFGSYSAATGTLESSTFDTGTSSNFYTFSWTPLNQPPLSGASSVKFQFAANASSTDTVWSYLGPDGTPNTYYSVPGATLSNVHNGKEYARYMAYISTETATVTPKIANISFSYTSSCIPPGQVLFQGLSTGTYTLNISKSGYANYSGSITIGSGWQQKTVLMAP